VKCPAVIRPVSICLRHGTYSESCVREPTALSSEATGVVPLRAALPQLVVDGGEAGTCISQRCTAPS
jgi:hypothetical protein